MSWLKRVVLGFVGIFLAAICLGIVVLAAIIFLPRIRADIEWRNHHNQWIETGIEEYQIELKLNLCPLEDNPAYLIELQVQGEQHEILESSHPLEDMVLGYYQGREIPYTVEALFNMATDCWLLCNVEYNSDYGYPEKIYLGAFIEGVPLQIDVIKFTPNLSE